MGGGLLEESEWERIFRQKRAIEKMMEQHTLADVMAREKSPYLIDDKAVGANRAERRKQEAINRKGRSRAQCLMVNCRNAAPATEAFCAAHRTKGTPDANG